MSKTSPREESVGAQLPPEVEQNMRKDDARFTLQVVSPSAGVPPTLEFKQLSVYSQVKDIKTLIRNSIQTSPPVEQQRLIHRGRILARESETMLEIFGEDVLKASGYHTIHLVLRNLPENNESHPNSNGSAPAILCTDRPPAVQVIGQPLLGSIPRNNLHEQSQMLAQTVNPQVRQQNIRDQVEAVQNLVGQRVQHIQHNTIHLNREDNAAAVHIPPRTSSNGSTSNNQVVQDRTTEPNSNQNFVSKQQQQHQFSSVYEQEINFQKANPAQGTPHTPSSQLNPNLWRPDQSMTCTREGIGSNRERWQMSLNETNTAIPIPPNQNHLHQTQQSETSFDLQNASQNIDGNLPNHGIHNQSRIYERGVNPDSTKLSASATANSRSIDLPAFASRISPSSTSTPHILPSIPTAPNSADTRSVNNSQQNFQTPSETTVYILSSPTGPRAILMSNTQNFYTPLRNHIRHRPVVPLPVNPPVNQDVPIEQRNRTPIRRVVRERRNPNENLPEPGVPHANLPAGGMGVPIGQSLWFIARLVGFIWFFTPGDPSWTRWIMVNALASLIFILYTSIINGFAGQYWNPIRRYLDALIPLGPANPRDVPINPNNARVPAGNDDQHRERGTPAVGNGDNNSRRRGELNPYEVAARILENQRRAEDGWLMSQLRRIEQALLLFIASLVPGIGERHIAHRVGEANRQAEQQQQQALHATTENAPNVEDEATENSVTNQTEIENVPDHGESSNTRIPQNQGEADAFQAQPLIQI